MIKYKFLYEQCVDVWKEDWEFSKNLTAKAGTYVIVIGLVFGYSFFNLDTFYSSIEATLRGENSVISAHLLNIISVLFTLYFVCFAISLIFTLFSLQIKAYNSLPMIGKIAGFKEVGPNNIELEKQYYQLSKIVQKSINDNEVKTNLQGFYLAIAIWCLTIGSISLILIGSIFIFCKLF